LGGWKSLPINKYRRCLVSYIRKIDNKTFEYHYEIRNAYPDINFPSVITDEMLQQIGIDKIIIEPIFEEVTIVSTDSGPLPEDLVV
jgi:hypothetical protein